MCLTQSCPGIRISTLAGQKGSKGFVEATGEGIRISKKLGMKFNSVLIHEFKCISELGTLVNFYEYVHIYVTRLRDTVCVLLCMCVCSRASVCMSLSASAPTFASASACIIYSYISLGMCIQCIE